MATVETVTASAPSRARKARRKRLFPAAWLAGGVLLFVCYLRLADTWHINSDGGANELQAWDMLHGNLLLHGWVVSDVSFYTTELPQYALLELVFGITPKVVHLAAAMTYTAVVLLAVVLASGRATGSLRIVRVVVAAGILLAPQADAARLLVSDPNHIGTSVPVLACLLILDRSWRRWPIPVLTMVLLTWTEIADPLAAYAVAAPLAIVSGLRAYRELMPAGAGGLAVLRHVRDRLPWARYDLALACAAGISMVLAPAAVALIGAHGGWTEVPLRAVIVSDADMSRQISIGTEGILWLFGADIFGLPLGLQLALALLHLVGLALVIWALARGLRQFFVAADLVTQLLVAGIVSTLVVWLLGWPILGTADAHEISVVLPMGAVLAARVLGGWIVASRAIPALALVLAGYLFALGCDVTQRAVVPLNTSLTSWLVAHHFRSGLASYQMAASITLDSHGAITMADVRAADRTLVPCHWEASASWFDPRLHDATFVVTLTNGPGGWGWGNTPAQAAATFGDPARTYRYDGYVVQVWNRNLLTDLHSWAPMKEGFGCTA
jgi:hypothetical protein